MPHPMVLAHARARKAKASHRDSRSRPLYSQCAPGTSPLSTLLRHAAAGQPLFPLNWLQVFRRQQQLAAVIGEAHRGIRVQGGQKNA
jgi:hypothetical protein